MVYLEEKVNKWIITIKILFCSCLFCSALPAYTYAQDATVTLKQNGISVKQVLREIEKQTKLAFVYSPKDVDPLKPLNVNFTNAKISYVLDFCLKNTNLTWNRHDNTVVIKQILKNPQLSRLKISGIVKDEQGNVLPGVTVLIKGTVRGVSTNSNGEFSLLVTDTTDLVVRVSFIGMKTQEIAYNSRNKKGPWVIVMQENAHEVDEVVVTGYQTIDKSLSAASTYSVKMEDIMVPGSTSLTDMLQGEVPGLMILHESGSPSALPKIRMRGTATLTGDASPVWVIDGIIQESPTNLPNEDIANTLEDEFDASVFGGAISGLNPADIESITFLKDAAATAMYGTRAANGVIVITTKKGNSRKLSVNYSGNLKFLERPSYRKSANVMNSQERMAITREIFDDFLLFEILPNDGYEKTMIDYLKGQTSYSEVVQEYQRREKQNTDWFDLLFRNSVSDSHTLSVSGGSEQITYYLSLGLANDRGVQKDDNAKRYTVSMRVNAELTKWLRADIKLNYSDRKVWSFFNTTPMSYALETSRTIAPDEDYVKKLATLTGTVDGTRYSFENNLTFNIFDELKNTSNTGRTREFSGSINMNIKLLKGLSGDIIFAYRDGRSLGIRSANEQSYYMAEKRGYDYNTQALASMPVKLSQYPYGGFYERRDQENNRWELRGTLKFQHVWNEAHALTLMGGGQISSVKNTGHNSSDYGYFPDRGETIYYEYNGVDAGYLGTNYGSSAVKHRVTLTNRYTNSVKLLASLVYDYKRRYILNAGASMDGTNRFGENKKFRFSPIWSVSGRWNISEEAWMKDLNWLSELNIKASYGYQGNVVNSISPSMKAKYYPYINATVGEFRLQLQTIANTNLDWEKTETINLGVNMAFWKNRLAFSAEYFTKRGSKILYKRELPTEYGIESTYLNDSKIKNYGYEFSLRGTLIKNKNLNWSITTNIAYVRNRTHRSVLRESYTNYLAGRVAHPDKPVGSFWSWDFKGLGEDGLPIFDFAEDKGYTKDELVADPTKYLVYSGSKNPDVTGGIRTNISYRAFSFSAAFAYALGAKRRLATVYRSSSTYTKVPVFDANLPSDFIEHWRKAGDENHTNNPGFLRPGLNAYYTTPGGNKGMYQMWDESQYRVVSANFLRCKSMTLSYRVPSKVLSKMKLSSMALSVTGTDLFVLKDKRLRKQDPESSYAKVPLLPSYSVSINVGF